MIVDVTKNLKIPTLYFISFDIKIFFNFLKNFHSIILEYYKMNSNTYNKLTDDIINQIKDFKHSYDPYYDLTEEQKSLIDELIPNEELREQYKKNGLCKECNRPNTGKDKYSNYPWCQSCNSKHFQNDFNKW